jgi:transposase
MVLEQGLSQPEVARKLSIPNGTMGNWVSKSKSKANPEIIDPEERTVLELAEEIKHLRKAPARAQMEREILKKATVYFAKESTRSTRS